MKMLGVALTSVAKVFLLVALSLPMAALAGSKEQGGQARLRGALDENPTDCAKLLELWEERGSSGSDSKELNILTAAMIANTADARQPLYPTPKFEQFLAGFLEESNAPSASPKTGEIKQALSVPIAKLSDHELQRIVTLLNIIGLELIQSHNLGRRGDDPSQFSEQHTLRTRAMLARRLEMIRRLANEAKNKVGSPTTRNSANNVPKQTLAKRATILAATAAISIGAIGAAIYFTNYGKNFLSVQPAELHEVVVEPAQGAPSGPSPGDDPDDLPAPAGLPFNHHSWQSNNLQNLPIPDLNGPCALIGSGC